MNDIETAKEKKAKSVRDEVVANSNHQQLAVANSSQSEAAKPSVNHIEKVDANCNHLGKGEITLSQHDIEKLIITVRGEQVLIDQDIARLYGVTTKRLNQQANRNSARFPSNFRFELTKEERDEVVANCDHLQSLKFRPTLPYAFTEQGIGQLSSVVHSQKAIERSIVIMNAFVAMRRFIVQNAGILMRIANLERHQIETDEKIDLILDKMDERSPKLLPEQIFGTGCVWDAWAFVSDLVRNAKKRIVLIDNFVDDRVLSLLDKRADGVTAAIHSRYYKQFQIDLNKHNEQYPVIEFVQLSHKNHDRFLIIDNKVYLMGASLKDMGSGLCAVTEMTTAPERILELLK